MLLKLDLKRYLVNDAAKSQNDLVHKSHLPPSSDMAAGQKYAEINRIIAVNMSQ